MRMPELNITGKLVAGFGALTAVLAVAAVVVPGAGKVFDAHRRCLFSGGVRTTIRNECNIS